MKILTIFEQIRHLGWTVGANSVDADQHDSFWVSVAETVRYD